MSDRREEICIELIGGPLDGVRLRILECDPFDQCVAGRWHRYKAAVTQNKAGTYYLTETAAGYYRYVYQGLSQP